MSDLKDFSSGEGVQVLFAEEGGYRCDAHALRRVAGGDARGLPAAVVSVAGATRGGKSFLLDFFLRYLQAPEAARRSGEWLGTEDAPLTGFSWRGGWERNTMGILLWSEPIVVTYEEDGHEKKIAVLLMDTQGTFDNTSTVKDCTTIFAMSTLISSVQIYNLSQIIKEDDLQHLQLFTEYGKLAREHENEKPFQALIFRVRDWMCPYEHTYGAQGGEEYLKTILYADTKNKESKDLRDHIRSSFETVSCFLTPHPGMAVADRNFKGRLCDLQPEFRQSLLEFVPLIFHPSNLIPKVINGRVVTVGELTTYFRSYLDIFNGEDLPTPVSIFQATSAADLELALSACRDKYHAHMEQCARSACVPRAAVARHHAAALDAARHTFAARRTLAMPALAAARLDSLLQELDASLPDLVAINNAKILKVISECRSAYEAEVRGARQDARPLCLHPLDAPALHAAAAAAAVTLYDADGPPRGEDNDPDRYEMLQWLDARGKELLASNELSNAAACAAASAVYAAQAQRVRAEGGLASERLQREHAAARVAAITALRAARSRASTHADDDDCYMIELVTKIDEEFSVWEKSNSRSNRAALRVAAGEYSARMARAQGRAACSHPHTLRRHHADARAAAWRDLCADIVADDGSKEQNQLYEELEHRFKELERSNEAANEALVTASYAEYCHRMDTKCAPSLTSILVIPWVLKVLVQLPQYHETACGEARGHFRANRCSDPTDNDDDYVVQLNKKLADGYDLYCNPIIALARELNVPLPQ